MGIAIHHGANGSFKTSGAIQDYFIPAAREGRVVVTNIAGVSRENTLEHMPDIPDSFDVIFINTDNREGRERIARWFHWVPFGALLLFDEAGVIFPKAWNQKMIDSLSYDGGLDMAEKDNRPYNWEEAWQKHRHYNWDIVLTAPNIKYIRDDIRLTSEGGYKHRNRALLGPLFKGYNEGYHDGQKDGKSVSDFEDIKPKRIDSLTFKLYNSTKTGVFKNTFNGFNLLLQPKIVALLGVAIGAVFFSLETGGLSLVPEVKKSDKEVSPSPVPVNSDSTASKVPVKSVLPTAESDIENDSEKSALSLFNDLSKTFDSIDNDASISSSVEAGKLSNGPLKGSLMYISGYVKSASLTVYTLTFVSQNSSKTYLSTDLKNIGYSVSPLDHCSANVLYKNISTPITCISLYL